MKQKRFLTRVAPALAMGMVLAAVQAARAQSAYNSRLAGGPDMAGVASSAGSIQSPSSAVPQGYNMRIGGVYLRTSAGVTFQYNDNITLREDNKQSDFIITPRANLAFYVPFSERNGFRFGVDIGGAFYMENSEYNNLILSPSGGNSFEFYAETKHWQFRIRDTFNLTTSPILFNQSQSQDVRLFNNNVMLAADGDFNRVVAGGSYSHGLVHYFTANYDYLNNQNDAVNLYAGYKISENLITGLSYDFNYTYYSDEHKNDSIYQGASAYAQFVLSPTINGRVSAGYGWSNFDSNDKANHGDEDNYGNLILAGVLNHTINNYLRHSITVAKTMTPSVDSNFSDTWDVNYRFAWDINPYLTLEIPLGYTHYETSSDGYYNEEADIYRIGISTGYQLTKRLNTRASYQYTNKDSTSNGASFQQNLFTLGLDYQF